VVDLALYCLLEARRSGWRLGPVLGFWMCVAGATMSKGPMGLAALGAGAVSVAATDGWRGLAPRADAAWHIVATQHLGASRCSSSG
jgi:4-amino-4-deoxy-L-arabinose transferase-like glycosyltransferase